MPQVCWSPLLVSPNRPLWISKLPPDLAFLSWKFITPAMASEPYCAEAPSRSTSTCCTATAGMIERSGPCEPSAIPLPSHAITAARWLPLPVNQDQRVVRS